MAHPREKLALCPVGAIGLLFRPTAFADLSLQLLVGRAQLGGSFLHAQLELLGLARDALVEPGLLEHDGELGGHFLRDADLLGREVARRPAEAHRTDQLTAGDHRDHHIRSDVGCEEGFRLGTRGQRVDIDHLWFTPPQGLQIARQTQRVADGRAAIEPTATDGGEPLDFSGP